MNTNPIFSICIPTYNSEKTLSYTLESILQQNFDKNKIEVLIVDGGSTDNTLNVAKNYSFVKIIKNEKRLPEFAKLKAINAAMGKYYIIMDSDEAFTHSNVLAQRLLAFEMYPEAKVLVADKLIHIKGFGISGNYLNICGDPFTWFIYKNKYGNLTTFKENIVKQYHSEAADIKLLNFTNNNKTLIADSGTTTYNLEFIKSQYKNKMNDIKFVTTMVDNVLKHSNYCLCIENDNVFHRSKSQFKTYLKKIKFRVINNIFTPNEAGFSSRKISKNNRKYLFPIYTFSFIFPLIDSLILSITNKKLSMMLHIFYSYYTTILIVYFMLLKLLGVKKTNKEY